MNKLEILRVLLGDAIKTARESRNVSRYMLAQKLGTQLYHVTRIENGIGDMRLSSVVKIAIALDMAPGELLDPVAAGMRGNG